MLSQSLAMREGREKILLPKLVPCTRKITLHVSDRTEPNRTEEERANRCWTPITGGDACAV